uniref:Uncharacterized protein n=1 Tax=Chromera velia CCMP2878 TaxID=1169474 RepID=A0A0G4FIZ4_9ALVE|eukprot:Cvel_17274.t1-p1 / transcript=Cvel_17274.t1 / gene=Cvel_17274 / organism=Chromera_velia_CCMP2878 / gene_product=hypothetical protein / transcript_product=hypothetical protein / location=Cvel_scaffold1370:6277-12016(-) / protein_length=285 / sequence_SO=supercontig / SO=protein_coding / is_pseudo=false
MSKSTTPQHNKVSAMEASVAQLTSHTSDGVKENAAGALASHGAETEDTSDPPKNWGAALLRLLKNDMNSTVSTDVSELAQRKDSYGVAWLMLHYMQKKKIRALFKSLDLTDTHISPGKLRLLLATLPKSTEELKLGRRSFIRFGDVISHFLGSLGDSGQNGTEAHVASLRSLWLQDCGLNEEKVLQLFPALPRGLEDLKLDVNAAISPVGWEALGARLKSLAGLKRLNLGGNGEISFAGWEALGARLKSLEGLKRLDLSFCGVSSNQEVTALFLSLPIGLSNMEF